MAYFIHHEANNGKPAHLEHMTASLQDDLNSRAMIARWLIEEWAYDEHSDAIDGKSELSDPVDNTDTPSIESQIAHALHDDAPLTLETAEKLTCSGYDYYPTIGENIIGASIVNKDGVILQSVDAKGKTEPQGKDFDEYWDDVTGYDMDYDIKAVVNWLPTRPNWIGSQAQPIIEQQPATVEGAPFGDSINRGPFLNLHTHTSLGTLHQDGTYTPIITVLSPSHPAVTTKKTN